VRFIFLQISPKSTLHFEALLHSSIKAQAAFAKRTVCGATLDSQKSDLAEPHQVLRSAQNLVNYPDDEDPQSPRQQPHRQRTPVSQQPHDTDTPN